MYLPILTPNNFQITKVSEQIVNLIFKTQMEIFFRI